MPSSGPVAGPEPARAILVGVDFGGSAPFDASLDELALLAESARTVTDAGGAYTALLVPLEGRARVARLYLVAALHRQAGGARYEMRIVNGLPAVLVTLLHPVRRQAPRTLLRCELDADGRIALVHSVLAPRKLAALHFA